MGNNVNSIPIALVYTFMLLSFNNITAQCSFSSPSGNWSDPANWSNCGGSIPLATSNVVIASGSAILDIAPTVQNFTLNGGTSITGTNSLTVNGNLVMNNSSQLANTGDVSVAGTFLWSSGTIGNPGGSATGTVTIAGYTTITGNAFRYLNTKTLNLNGGGILDNAGFTMQYNSVFNIPAGNTLIANSSGGSSISGSSATINNLGTLSQQGGALFSCEPPFNNGGAVNATAGTCQFLSGGTHTGSYSISAGATLEFKGGTNNISACSLTGSGLLKVSGGTVTLPVNSTHADVTTTGGTTNFSGSNTIQNLTASSGALNFQGSLSVNNLTIGSAILAGTCPVTASGNLSMGNSCQFGTSGDVSVAGTFLWSSGTIGNPGGSATGTVTIAGYTTITGNAFRYLNTKTLNLNGGGILDNAGFTMQYNSVFNIPAGNTLIANSSGGSSISGVNGTVNNAGVFDKQGSGVFSCEPTFNNSGTIKGINTFTFFGAVTNSGLISPGASPGIMNFGKPAPGMPVFDLNIELQGPSPGTSGYDQINNTTGPININGGVLMVSLLNNYQPPVGTSFTIATGTSRTGMFSAVNFPVNNNFWSITYNATNVVITLTQSLPVELVDFSVQKHNSAIALNWETATEINNFGFFIERSTDAADFESIGIVNGAGTSYAPVKYHFSDEHFPEKPVLYYRLRQEDFDGKTQYSPIKSVKLPMAFSATVWPNPAHFGAINLDVILDKEAEIEVVLFDLLGNSIDGHRFFGISAGRTNLPIFLAEHPAGIYQLRVDVYPYTGNATSQSFKIELTRQ